jgi:tRNA dimethylallyltransferase
MRPKAAEAQPTQLILIGGPTASGKSRLALALAEELGGTVINADSMQLYRELRILTARPTPEEEARAPHRLYGVLPASERGSVGRWREMALAEIAACAREGRPAIVVGGTGLYLQALTEGLAPLPEVPEEIRADAERLHRRLGGAAFRLLLAERDPEAARRLAPGDTQRLVRAWAVVEATGLPLSAWWERQAGNDGGPQPALSLRLEPPRDLLYAAIDRRFEAMVEAGALAEVTPSASSLGYATGCRRRGRSARRSPRPSSARSGPPPVKW